MVYASQQHANCGKHYQGYSIQVHDLKKKKLKLRITNENPNFLNMQSAFKMRMQPAKCKTK